MPSRVWMSLTAAGLAAAASVSACGGQWWLSVSAFISVAALARVVWGSADPSTQIHGTVELRGTRTDAIALSFDDGPDPASTPALLSALRQAGATATFFVLVDRAERYPQLTRDIAAEHELALHGLTHSARLTVLPAARGTAELREGVERLRALCGVTVTRFRPPFGAMSPRLAAAAAGAGLVVSWGSVRTRDGANGSAARLIRRMKTARGGDIAILHEGARPAREVLPTVLADLKARGLSSVSIAELVGA